MKTKLIPVLLLVSLIWSCKKDDNDDPAQVNGKITGELRLTDEFGNELAQHSNMKVSTQTGAAGYSVASGAFQLTNLATGMYDLSFEKTGFGTFKKFDIAVNGGANGTILNGITYLGMQSTSVITNLSVGFSSVDSTYNIGCSVSPMPDSLHPRAFRLFFDKVAGVSSTDYLFTPSNTWVSTTGSGVITGFLRQTLYSNGFSAGDSVYVIAYGESLKTNVYTDPLTGDKVYPNLNTASPSNTEGFVLQ